jgi:regulator of protease activity HflC (stomatin/prohibitin superfamily)
MNLGLLIIVIIVGLYLLSSIKILPEYERGVIFRLGRLLPEAKGPGIFLVFAPIDRIVRVSLRQEAFEVPPQDIITRDNVTLKVNAVVFLRVIEPRRAVVEVFDYRYQTSQFAQTTLRSVLGEAELDSLLSDREHLNESLQQVIDMQTEPWGIKVTMVEIRDVEIPERMQHAIARQAEAERERRAKIINAEGEFQASARLRDAAEVMGDNSVTLQLRYLQTLREIGGSQNSTIVFPIPIDVVRPMMEALSGANSSNADAERLAEAARSEAERIESGSHPELEAGEPAPDATPSGQEANGSAVPSTPAPSSAAPADPQAAD